MIAPDNDTPGVHDGAMPHDMPPDIAPRAGFNWTQVVWWAADGPAPCHCSYCTAPLGAGELTIDMAMRSGWAAAFCEHCAWEWWGIERLA